MIFDVIVVGLGAVGSATTWQLARRGARVLGIDRYAPPHDQGSSHGHSRITRLAVGEGAEYVPLAQRSHQIWRELEGAVGVELMVTTGGLVLGPSDGRSEMHGRADFVGSSITLARQFGIAHEVLGAGQINDRFPQFQLRGDERGYFEPDAGMLRPEACVAAQIEMARRAGATLLTGEAVQGLAADNGTAVAPQHGGLLAGAGGWQTGSDTAVTTVHTATRSFRGRQVVVCAGNWLPALAGGQFAQTLKVQRQTLHWFRPDAPAAYAPGRFPVFIWSHGAASADSFYGFPMGDGVAGVKVATQQYEVATSPEQMDRQVAPQESAAMHAHHVHGRLRGLSAVPVHAAACAYTVAPGSRFVVAGHPQMPGVLVVSACSGHGFKHSAALGECVAQELLEGGSAIPLAPFGWSESGERTAGA